MQRYRMIEGFGLRSKPKGVQDEDGEWVKYEDCLDFTEEEKKLIIVALHSIPWTNNKEDQVAESILNKIRSNNDTTC